MVSHNTKMLPTTLVGGNFFFCSKITLIANKQRIYRKYFIKFSISSLVLRYRLVYYVISTKYTNTISISCYDFSVQVTNSAGDTSMLSLTVMIRNRTARHPVITLSDYLVYATGDETPEDYRSLITSVLQSEHGASVDPSKVEISGKIDHEHPGSYDVLFSYTNDAGLESSVILTVVVE